MRVPDARPAGGLSVLDGGESPLASIAVLVRSGVLGPGRPDRVARRLIMLAKYGPTLAGAFGAAAARAPQSPGVADDKRSVTYGELDARVRRIAAGLAEQGIKAGDSIAMYQRNSVYAVETMVSSSRLGANALLLNTFLAPAQLSEILYREKPRLIVVDADLLPNLVDVPEGTLVVLGDPLDLTGHEGLSLDGLAGSTAADVPVPEKPGRLVILTSGTTGTPKGALRASPKGLGPVASMFSRVGLRKGGVMLIAPPLFHTLGLGFLQLGPALGAGIVLRRNPSPENLLEALTRHRCTSAILVPVMAQRMLDVAPELLAKADTSALKVVVCSSAPLPPDVATRFQDRFGDVLYNIYGSTEVTWATIAKPEDQRAIPGCVGRPPLGTKLALLDADGKPVPVGEKGNIHVGNEMMFEGYTNGNDRSRIDGLMGTGDIGVLSPDGLLSVLGRDDDMVIVGGENVYPLEVEELLTACPEVREVAVVGVPDDSLGQRLAAYVCLADGHTLSADEVRDRVKARLARFSVPRDVVFLEALPRNTVGKVVPRLLPEPTSAASQN